MKLPAFFGHKRSINLLPRDPFENSTLGTILEWALVFGKWSVIVTQLVVMGAFLWRFALDRQLTDLRSEIARNVAIVKSYEQIETDFILAQKQIAQAKSALVGQKVLLDTLDKVVQITPSEVWYDRITMNNESINLAAYSVSLNGFGQFLTLVQNDPMFGSVKIGKIESSTNRGAQMQFDITMELRK